MRILALVFLACLLASCLLGPLPAMRGARLAERSQVEDRAELAALSLTMLESASELRVSGRLSAMEESARRAERRIFANRDAAARPTAYAGAVDALALGAATVAAILIGSAELAAWLCGSGVTVFALAQAANLQYWLTRKGRFGDIALHDGAPTGTRDDGQGGEVHVFNAFECWRPSETPTHTAFVRCPDAADAHALAELLEQHGWTAEDWTQSLRYLCLRCSYGIPHEHTDAAPSVEQADTWQTERSIGIAAPAAQSAELETALQNWAAAALGREVSDICRQDYPLPARQDGRVWWIGSSE